MIKAWRKKDILTLLSDIEPLYEEYSISSSYIDESNNCVVVEYMDKQQYKIISEAIHDINAYDIQVVYQLSEYRNENSSLEGGSKVIAENKSCSLGIPAKKGSTNGILTARHCFSLGSQTNYGNVTARSYGPSVNMDAEFIETGISIPPYADITSGYSGVSTLAFQGMTVKCHTWLNKTNGAITSTNASATFSNDGSYSNLILASFTPIGGMSGAAVISTSGTSLAVGILKGGHTNNSYIINNAYISGKLGVTLGH